MQERTGDEKIKVNVPSYAIQLIPKFLKSREKDIKEVEDSLKRKDFETIERLGHSMKGAGSMYGFDGISELGKLIELSAKDKNTVDIMNSLSELKDYLSRIEIVNE
ncbi:Hpt domain-containing protein [candidate division WOR-3 bacterium]|nr:Hpt domain-containing protein [candidate division WOR-3 bacterium]